MMTLMLKIVQFAIIKSFLDELGLCGQDYKKNFLYSYTEWLVTGAMLMNNIKNRFHLYHEQYK